MKKVLSLALILLLCLSLFGCGGPAVNDTDTPSAGPEGSPEAAPSTVPDEPDATGYEVTYAKARSYVNSIGTTWIQTIIEIENTGNTDLYLASSAYDLEDSSGKLVASRSMVSAYPDVIGTGEKGYIYEETTLDEPVEGELTVIPRPAAEKAKIDPVRYSVSEVEITAGQYGGLKALGRIENTGTEDSSGLVYIALVMKDSGGTPIGLMFTILSETLAAGDKIGFEVSSFALPDDVTAESVASFEAFAYPLQMQF